MDNHNDETPAFSRTALGSLADLDDKIECRYGVEAKISLMRTAKEVGFRNGYADFLRVLGLRATFGYQFVVDHYGTIVAEAVERHLVKSGRDVGQMSVNRDAQGQGAAA